MSKALIIKGASFSTNALTKVTFSEVIPCTGISISESSVSLTDYTPVDLQYTVTPNNTTDSVSWSSSDTSVCTVSEGTITAVGFGTATITATCGNYSDTVTVTVTLAYIETYALGAATNIATNVEPNIVATGDSGYRFTAYGSGAQATTYEADTTTTWEIKLKAIKLPGNVAKVKVSRSADKTAYFDNSPNRIIWCKDEWSGNSTWPNSIKPISVDEFSLNSAASYSYSVPSGADSCFVNIVFKNRQSTPEDFEATIETTGIQIEFLTE